MLIEQKTGRILSTTFKRVDWVELQWYETNKRILRKDSKAGTEIIMKFLKENQLLIQGDIIYEDAETVIVIDILPCECIVVKPKTTFEIATVCYEIGNRHVPLYVENDELLTAWETPLFNLLVFLGYDVTKEERKLITPLKTSVEFQAHPGPGIFFSKSAVVTSSER